MHELGLAEGILRVALDVSQPQSVRRVSVRAGRQLAAVQDSLGFSFQLLAEGTRAEGARLDLVVTDGDSLRVDEVECDSGEVIRRPGITIPGEAHSHIHETETELDDHPAHPAWL